MPTKSNRRSTTSTTAQYSDMVRSFKIVSTVALVVGIVAIAIGVTALVYSIGRPPPSNTIIIENSTHSTTTVNQAGPGSNLAGINQPLNATQLSIINNASSAYFEQAALMLLNGSIKNQISDSAPYVIKPVTPFKYGNKTTVVYLGSITCIFCGENRWAMALALSRFGNFTSLYTGYSSLGDGDVPTIYWLPDTVNSSNDVLGNHYASNQVDFVAIEDTNPISGGFQLNSLSTIQANIQKANSTEYKSALNYIINLSNNKTTAFSGTPYTVWGNHLFLGADASDFGNTTSSVNGYPEMSYMSHAQIFDQLANPNDQFAWTEYAAADIYIVSLCDSTGNAAPVCKLGGIKLLEAEGV